MWNNLVVDTGFLLQQILTDFGISAPYLPTATLLVLKQPGPGEEVRQREGMSSIKLKAFRTILIITVSVIVMYVHLMVVIILKDYLTQKLFMSILTVNYTCTVFSGFVQALLFLQRCGKLHLIKWPQCGSLSVKPA